MAQLLITRQGPFADPERRMEYGPEIKPQTRCFASRLQRLLFGFKDPGIGC